MDVLWNSVVVDTLAVREHERDHKEKTREPFPFSSSTTQCVSQSYSFTGITWDPYYRHKLLDATPIPLNPTLRERGLQITIVNKCAKWYVLMLNLGNNALEMIPGGPLSFFIVTITQSEQ